ncbi:MAG: carbonic anhydrase [Alphaproteobacteria bacterium]|nr:carbonic anhydrase [Alphaproteobacteria bacterium]
MTSIQGVFPFKGVLPTIAADAYLSSTAIVIGDVVIGPESSIWHHVTIRGDVNTIRIGARTNIQDGSVVHVNRVSGGHTVIGNDITIGHMALIHACELQDNSFVGMKACVMDGAVIESFGMLAAGALLTPGKIIRSRELWMGSPARFVRHLTEEDLQRMADNGEEYRVLAKAYE